MSNPNAFWLGYGLFFAYSMYYILAKYRESIHMATVQPMWENENLKKELSDLGINGTLLLGFYKNMFSHTQEPLINPWFVVHVVASGIWTLLPIFQFFPYLRNEFPVVHRWIGRVWMIATYSQALSGFYIIQFTGVPGMLWKSTVLGISIISLICSTLAWYYARNKNFSKHRQWVLASWCVSGTFLIWRPVIDALRIILLISKKMEYFHTQMYVVELMHMANLISVSIVFCIYIYSTSIYTKPKQE